VFWTFKHCFILYSLPPFAATLGQTSLLPSQLARNYDQSLGASGYQLELTASPHQRGAPSPLISYHHSAVEEEVQKLLTKGAIVEVERPGQFISRLFLVTKKDGSFRPVVNLKPLNQFIAKAHFKMEGINMLKEGQLDGLHRLKGSLSLCGNSSGAQEVPPLHLGGTDIRISVSPIWVEQCSKSVHQAPEASGGLPETTRDSSGDIPGRHASPCPKDLRNQISQIAQLFHLLGFTINHEKSQVNPAQQIHFLGSLIDSQNLMIQLTQEKTDLLISTCRTIKWWGSLSARELARLIGRMTAMTPAVFQAPLRYRNMQRLKIQTLRRSQSYEALANLDQDTLLELDWSMLHQNRRSILPQVPDLKMEFDASLRGWGAVCEGVCTGGLWSPMERLSYINCLELTAAMFAVKALSRDKVSSHIHLKLDNQTAVSYINHMGRTRFPQLNSLAAQLWTWCLERRITLSVEHWTIVWETSNPERSCPQQNGSSAGTSSWERFRPYLFDFMLRGPDRLHYFLNKILCYKIESIEDHPMLLNCTDMNGKTILEIYFQIWCY